MIRLTEKVTLADPTEEVTGEGIVIRLVPAFPEYAFGYGWHRVTKGMIEKLQGLDFTGKTVYDIGTGCGIQAILVKKLGAKTVIAVDTSSSALKATKKNAEANGVEIELLERNAQTLGEGIADVVIYTLDDKNIDKYKHILKKGGDFYEMES